MKKHLLFLSAAALLFAGTASAQIINPAADDFEVWAGNPIVPSIKDPNTGAFNVPGWQTLNTLNYVLLGNSPQSVFQDSGIVHSGKYSCKIMSVALEEPTSYNIVKSFIPHDTVGIAFTGVLQSSPAIKVGVPFTRRISTFNFFYQYYPTGTDTAFCTVVLSHHFGGRNTIGAGITTMTASASWKMGTVAIGYDSGVGHSIDTITVMFSSSSFTKPHWHSTLYIDGTSVTGVNNIDAPSASVNVYPNPTSSDVNFHISPASGSVAGYGIEVYDITGKKVNTYKVTNNLTTINTNAYSSGLYFYQLFDQNGAQINVGKFSVVK